MRGLVLRRGDQFAAVFYWKINAQRNCLVANREAKVFCEPSLQLRTKWLLLVSHPPLIRLYPKDETRLCFMLLQVSVLLMNLYPTNGDGGDHVSRTRCAEPNLRLSIVVQRLRAFAEADRESLFL